MLEKEIHKHNNGKLIGYESGLKRAFRTKRMAELAIENRFYTFAARKLASTNAASQCRTLKSLIGKEKSVDAISAKAILCSTLKRLGEKDLLIQNLLVDHWKGAYYAARILMKNNKKGSEKIADMLDMDFKSSKDPARERNEPLFFAFDICRRLGKTEKSKEHLENLHLERDRYYLYASLLLEQTIPSDYSFIDIGERYMASAVLGDIEPFLDFFLNEGNYKSLHVKVEDMVDFMDDLISEENIEILLRTLAQAKQEQRNERNLKKIDAMKYLSKEDLKSIHQGMDIIKSTFRVDEYDEKRRMEIVGADKAASLEENNDAQFFAAGIYLFWEMASKAAECGIRILERGYSKDAEEIILRAANMLKFRKRIDKVRVLAERLEESSPLVAQSLYSRIMKEGGRTVGLASVILESDNLDFVERCAWNLSFIAKRNLEMRNALLKLESMGFEGKMRSDSIRKEMGIGLFVV